MRVTVAMPCGIASRKEPGHGLWAQAARQSRAGAQTGVTLIEVLVAMVVLSIGLLGMVGLQTHALAMNNSAYLRSQATGLGYDMGDRLRANCGAALQAQYDHALGAPAPSGGGVPGQDLAEWLAALDRALPAGEGGVQINGTLATVTVRWDDSRGAHPAEVFTTVTDVGGAGC